MKGLEVKLAFIKGWQEITNSKIPDGYTIEKVCSLVGDEGEAYEVGIWAARTWINQDLRPDPDSYIMQNASTVYKKA